MVLPEILRGDDAWQRVSSYARRYGTAHITLAMHASLPLGLTPDLLHLIRINFVRGAPWIAEADLLLSSLCREVGNELYEMIPQARELLLDELKSVPEFGPSRVKEVAEFLYEYSVRASKSAVVSAMPEMRDFYRAQEWVALAYVRPEEAAQSLALALKKELQAENQSEVVRLARLTQGLTAPLLSEEKVLLYSAGLEKLAAGENRSAQALFETLGPLNRSITIGGVELPPPASLQLAPPAAPVVDKKVAATVNHVIDEPRATAPIVEDKVKEERKPPPRSGFNEEHWEILLDRIREGRCTPVIGAGALAGILPLGSEIAAQWAEQYDYPFEDSDNLARVAQFVSVEYDPIMPKDKMVRLLRRFAPPDFTDPQSVQGVLANLPLSTYLSTTYDDFMLDALRLRDRKPRRELCRWNRLLEREESVFDYNFAPDPANPAVFHLFGHQEKPESLVLTEDDYLDFTFNTARNERAIPPRIERALTHTLLFIGIDPMNLGMRALLRSLQPYMRRGVHLRSVIQLPTTVYAEQSQYEEQSQRVQSYLERYFEDIGIRVYWGTAADFSAELYARWNASYAS
jgi:hypothetical protein